MEGNYPRFTPEMKKTHKILIPNMAPVQFRILAAAMEHQGYQVELLENCGSQVAELGLKYVHNDTCYPALLVIGQFIDALQSGKYDTDKVALLLTQTGGGCRASNYIFLLRKALKRAGFPQVPVISLSMGMESNPGFSLTVPLVRRFLAGLVYGDVLMLLRNQIMPYEVNKGDCKKVIDKWTDKLTADFAKGESYRRKEMNIYKIK